LALKILEMRLSGKKYVLKKHKVISLLGRGGFSFLIFRAIAAVSGIPIQIGNIRLGGRSVFSRKNIIGMPELTSNEISISSTSIAISITPL